MGSHSRRVRPLRNRRQAAPASLAIAALVLLASPGAVAAPARLAALEPALQAQVAPPPRRAVATVIVTEADDGRSLNLRRGEQLRVVLGDTAGTGYVWEVESVDRRLLQLEEQSSWQDPGPPPPAGFQGPAGLVGGPLQVSFLFRALAAGAGELRLRHWRPWEGPPSVDRRLWLRLRVLD